MGRFITGNEDEKSGLDGNFNTALFNEPSESPVHDYMLGKFGSGNRKIIFESGVWESPITGKIRVTCIGAGGGGGLVVNNDIAEDGGTTSFDTVLSATGGHGAPPLTTGGDGGAGGEGIGGDINMTGGQGGSNSTSSNGGGAGGGGVATPKGDGGPGGRSSSQGSGLYSTGGAGADGGHSSQNIHRARNAIPAIFNVSMFPLFNAKFTRYLLPAGRGMDGPFSLIGGDGGSNYGVGSAQGRPGGGGGGGYHRGGECGYGDNVSGLEYKGGDGGLGGGGGGGAGSGGGSGGTGGGGGGCAVKVLDVSENQQFNVTIGQGGRGAQYNDLGGKGGDGMIIVEW